LMNLMSLNDDLSIGMSNYYAEIDNRIYADADLLFVHSVSGDNGNAYKVIKMNLDSGNIQSIKIGKLMDISHVAELVSINGNKLIAVANPDRGAAYLAIGDFSQDISSPEITILNSESTIYNDRPFKLQWNASDNGSITKYQIYKIVNSTKELMVTIDDASIQEYSFVPTELNGYVYWEIVAVDDAGNKGYDVLKTRAIKDVSISDFSVDKYDINLGDELTFTWNADGGNATLYTVFAGEETIGWEELFTVVGTQTKSYRIENVAGEISFKITTDGSEKVLDSNVTVQGQLLRYNETKFFPQGKVYIDKRKPISLCWSSMAKLGETTYRIYMKRENDNLYTLIGETTEKCLEIDSNQTSNGFDWYVEADMNQDTKRSSIIHVQINDLLSPGITNATFMIEKGQAVVHLTFDSIEKAIAYKIYRENAGSYELIGTSGIPSYEDREVTYGMVYSYRVVAVLDNGMQSDYGSEYIVDVSHYPSYNVIMETPNYQHFDGNALKIKYKPEGSTNYEKYEILIGTTPEHMYLLTLTDQRQYKIDGLEYATTYYVQVYPLDPSGRRVSTVPATLTFTTGFDRRTIADKPHVSIDEVSEERIVLSWNEIPNADNYTVCRSENGEAMECLETIREQTYSDIINLIPGNRYRYVVKASNGNGFTVSDVTTEVVVPYPDSDGDGYRDDEDAFPYDPNRWIDTENITLKIQSIDDITTYVGGVIPDISIEANTSNGVPFELSAVSNNPEIVIVSIEDHNLTFDVTAEVPGRATVEVAASLGDKNVTETFDVIAVAAQIIVEDEIGNWQPIEEMDYSIEAEEVQLHVHAQERGVDFFLKRGNDRIDLQTTFPGTTVRFDRNNHVKIQLPMGRDYRIEIDPAGTVQPYLNGALLPVDPLPMGTQVQAGAKKLIMTVPVKGSMTFRRQK